MKRGWSLISLMTGIFVSALVMGTCVPLYLAAQREAEIAMARARMREEAREIAAQLRQDVRQASLVEVSPDGSQLAVTAAGIAAPMTARYTVTPAGLVRSARGSAAEVAHWDASQGRFRFGRAGRSVTLAMTLRKRVRARPLVLELTVSVTPRSAL